MEEDDNSVEGWWISFIETPKVTKTAVLKHGCRLCWTG